jgi:hypothetical protein
MPQIHTSSSKPAIAAVVLVLASVALAACGSSSSSSPTTTASTSASATTTTGRSPGAGHFAALRECLQKNGITLPKRTPGQRPSPGTHGFGAGGGPALPQGVTKAQYQAALKKCGVSGGAFFAGRGGRFNSPAAKQALAKFAACMAGNGVKIPAPNTSGNGPIFNNKGLDTSSATFRNAEAKCSVDLQGEFRASPGGPPSGAPPSAG